MIFRRSHEKFDPLEHAVPLTDEQMVDFGIVDYSKPKVSKEVDGVHVVKTNFTMEDGWKYKTASTVLPPDRIVTPVALNMTGGWFTDYDDGFNLRYQVAAAKLGMEGTSVSVPVNNLRGWGDLEANARNQARIHRGMAQMLGRHGLINEAGIDVGRRLDMSVVDGLSRGAMHGEAVTALSPEVGTDVLFAYYTVACRINGVEEVEKVTNVVRQMAPANLARIAMRGEIPDELTLAYILRRIRKTSDQIGEAFGNEFTPLKELVTTPLAKIKEGESIKDAIGDTIGKFHPNSMVIPYKILSRYPNSLDAKHIHRQILEAYTLTNGTYGKVAEKVSPNQFQVHTGFTGDGLSHFEEIIAAHDHDSHPHTIIETVEGGSHISCIIEEKKQEWRSRWATVISVLGEIGVEKLAELTPAERSEELHRRAAEKNPFFADETHPHNPTSPNNPKPRHDHLHAA